MRSSSTNIMLKPLGLSLFLSLSLSHTLQYQITHLLNTYSIYIFIIYLLYISYTGKITKLKIEQNNITKDKILRPRSSFSDLGDERNFKFSNLGM